MRFVDGTINAVTRSDDDPELLVLLADQELEDGREEQAQSLVDAVYAAFDKRFALNHGAS